MPKGRAKPPEIREKFGKRAVNNTYITEYSVIQAVLDSSLCDGDFSKGYAFDQPIRILDLCAGAGNWGQVARWYLTSLNIPVHITGIELNPDFKNPGTHDVWITKDFLLWDTDEKFNLVLSNPPFDKRTLLPIITKAIDLVSPYYGSVDMLLPVSFLASKVRAQFFKTHMPTQVRTLIPRPSFFRLVSTNSGTDTDEYIIAHWEGEGKVFAHWKPLEWERLPELEERFKQNPNYEVAKRIYEESRNR